MQSSCRAGSTGARSDLHCFLIELELIYNVMLVSGVQQSDSGIYI